MYRVVTALLLIFLWSAAYGGPSTEEGHKGVQKDEPGVELSRELKSALVKEMVSIQSDMKAMISSIASGDWDRIEALARNIDGSYILRQNLSEGQIQELHHSLPEGFRDMDAEFHRTAGRLAHAAAEHDGQLVSFYYYKMVEGCVTCHSTYAQHRFDKFQGTQSRHDHH